LGRYRETVARLTLKPSFSSSAWIFRAPQALDSMVKEQQERIDELGRLHKRMGRWFGSISEVMRRHPAGVTLTEIMTEEELVVAWRATE